MKFHINAIRIDIEIDGWKKGIQFNNDALVPLQDLELPGGASATLEVNATVLVGAVEHVLTLPVSLTCLPGKETISMDLPSTVSATRNGDDVDALITNPSFTYICLTPIYRIAHVIAASTAGTRGI